jgi:hypothetical protein
MFPVSTDCIFMYNLEGVQGLKYEYSCNVAYLFGRDINLLQIQIYVYEANHTAVKVSEIIYSIKVSRSSYAARPH